ncbi:D-2-hydroxyacid dehydrogenase [Roseomonas terrae]|jgi:glyoxylate/hydroxypyruvate reductase A|uniref:D-2-hydroxyacid dehydrogenase n=1 Tax=Neoroseomonas terrae TaxID=424799 RepID=A0ABS5EPJ5_9PROT|nr:D-2-hydroxyacid dehydrogenase [Neoroseomonas terrae]MBR0652960.1 D-2-hydroxyacid dehydrogenase [Neoroseomonas terrae]
MTKPLLLLWTDGAGPYAAAIEAAGLADRLRVEAVGRTATPDDTLLAEAEAMLAMAPPAGILDRMPKLRFVQALTAGVEHWLARPDLKPDLALSSARGTHRVQMPENILGALFHITKPYAAIVGDNAAHQWTRRVSTTLAGKTLGILGLGAIGAELARKAAALEMHVIGTRRGTGDMPHVDRVYRPEETDDVLAASDFVVLLLPATPATENFIDAGRLAAMKKTAWLLNFGRGALIKDDDLVAAVRAGTIAGAVLDVFRTEPLPADHPFWAEENIMVLPHIGGLHPERDKMVAALLVENLHRFVEGAPLTQLVDRQAGY